MPIEKATLGPIRESLLHIDVRNQHDTHEVFACAFRDWIPEPIPGQMQVPQRLRSDFLFNTLGPSFSVPPLVLGICGPNTRFDSQGVVAFACEPAHDDAVPFVSVTTLHENRRASLEVLCSCGAHRSPIVCFNYIIACLNSRLAIADVRDDSMKFQNRVKTL